MFANRMGADTLPVRAMLAFAIISFARLASSGFSSALTTRDASQSPSQVILVHPSDNLSAVLEHASPGDVLLLANGRYLPGVKLVIDRNITIAAQNVGQAVLDGQNDHGVIHIHSGTVVVKGLNITGGYCFEVHRTLGQCTRSHCPIGVLAFTHVVFVLAGWRRHLHRRWQRILCLFQHLRQHR